MPDDIFAKVIVDELQVNAKIEQPKVTVTVNDPASKVTIANDSDVAVLRYVSTTPASFSVDITAPTSVFDVSGGPITNNGVIDISFVDQGKSTFFAGPVSASGLPTFRSIQTSDLPDLSSKYISEVKHDSTLSGKGTVADPLTVVTGGSVGTVNSIDLDSTDFDITGGPVTSSGVITLNLGTNGVTSGTYGSQTEIPVLTIDSKGRVTNVENKTITIPPSGVTSVGLLSSTLTITNTPITSTGVIGVELPEFLLTVGSYGTNLKVPEITIDKYGRITKISEVAIGVPGLGVGTVTSVGLSSSSLNVTNTLVTSSGLLNVDLYETTVTAGSYTNADITVDKYGRITNASDGNPGIPPGGLTSQVLTYNASNTLVWVYADGGTW